LTAQAKIQAEQANKAKDKFLSIISHDLRGPTGSMSVILNEVAKNRAELTDELYSTVQLASKHTHALLENLLTWANNQSGTLECKPKNFLLLESVKQCVELLQAPAKQKDIQVKVAIEPNLYVKADVEMVNTIVRNLLNNAIKFTHPQGTIEIAAKPDKDNVQLVVADNGIGMSENTRKKLFSIEERINSRSGTSDELGTGLGLNLCADFARRNGGTISVESEEGKGSQFTVSLPLGGVEIALQEVVEKIKGWKIVVAEDNALHQITTNQALKNLGFTVIMTSSGEEAVRAVIEEQPELVLMDFDLPDMTGDLAAKQITERSSSPPQAVIALTSYSKAELDNKAVEYTFDGFLHKPLKSTALLDCLSKIRLS
jgi:CheY-like chemotaxis protein/anti-sigma regulatory factor (Ser/Thr protein kinase)